MNWKTVSKYCVCVNCSQHALIYKSGWSINTKDTNRTQVAEELTFHRLLKEPPQATYIDFTFCFQHFFFSLCTEKVHTTHFVCRNHDRWSPCDGTFFSVAALFCDLGFFSSCIKYIYCRVQLYVLYSAGSVAFYVLQCTCSPTDAYSYKVYLYLCTSRAVQQFWPWQKSFIWFSVPCCVCKTLKSHTCTQIMFKISH